MITTFHGEHRFLSNFWPCQVTFEDQVYPSAEHAYQAAKTLSRMERAKVALLPKAGDAKRYGRRIALRKDWENVKVSVMRDVLLSKFADPALQKLLIGTGNEVLQEGNTWGDTFWGICNGKGQNFLGRLLMEIRDTI